MNKKTDVMIDIETLGTRSTSMIVQIGACFFDRETGEIGNTFSKNLYHHGDKFTTDYATIKWWMNQSKEAQESLLSDAIPTEVAIGKLISFLGGAKQIWSHASFDIPILTNAFNKCGYSYFPIRYTGIRDIRTLMDVADHRMPKEREGIHHNALDDCKFQVGYCVEALNKLKK